MNQQRTLFVIAPSDHQQWFAAKTLTLCSADEKYNFLPYYLSIKHHHVSGTEIDYKKLASLAECSTNSIRKKIPQIIKKGYAYYKGKNLHFVSTRDLKWNNKKKQAVNEDGIGYSRKVKQYITCTATTVKELKLEVRNFMVANIAKNKRTAMHYKFKNAIHQTPTYCAVSGAEVANKIGRSRTTASRHLAKMENQNIITKTPMEERIKFSSFEEYNYLRQTEAIPYFYKYRDGAILRPLANKIEFVDTNTWYSIKTIVEEVEIEDNTVIQKPIQKPIHKEWFLEMPKGYFWKSYLVKKGFSNKEIELLWNPNGEVRWKNYTGGICSVNKPIMSFNSLRASMTKNNICLSRLSNQCHPAMLCAL